MKKLFILLVGFIIFFPITAKAEEKIDLYLFYGDGCPHCEIEKEDLIEMQKEYPQLVVHQYEIWYSKKNREILEEIQKRLGVEVSGVPFTVIGDRAFTGYSSIRRKEFEQTIEYFSANSYRNIVGDYLNNTSTDSYETPKETEKESKIIGVPIFGEIETKDLSLPIITIIIGIVDGFNPCAMWILLFLISMLIGMENKKRMWTLGLTFIITSGVVYFMFMAVWLNLIMFIGTIIFIRTIIGFLGIGGGLFSIRNYIKEKNDDGCQIIDKKKRKGIFDKIRKFTHEKSFLLATAGIILLAISVNLIEMLCSLGLPAIYVEILSLSHTTEVGRYFYLILYVLFFMLDDIIIFAIAMFTLRITGISTKYSKYAHLIGGIIMITIGLLLIFKPEVLLFG